MTYCQIYGFRKRYFGNELAAAPKDKERKAKLDGEEFDEVCEGAYLVALGKHGNLKTNQVRFDYIIYTINQHTLLISLTNIGIKILGGCEKETCQR